MIDRERNSAFSLAELQGLSFFHVCNMAICLFKQDILDTFCIGTSL